MKKLLFFMLAFLPLYWSCSNEGDKEAEVKGENDIDAARMFIRSALDGKWKAARQMIVQDPVNIEDLETAQRMADRWDATTQRNYREAQINIHNTRKVSDTESIITYSNTFKKQRDSVRVVKVGNQWLVDLKYSFPHTNAVQQ